MSRPQTGPVDNGEKGPTALPFIVAAVICLVALLGITLWHILRPSDDRLTDSAKVSHSIGQYYGAQNEQMYQQYVSVVCAIERQDPKFPSAAVFSTTSRDSVEKNGRVTVEEIDNTTVTGDAATAKIVWHYDKSSDNKKTEQIKLVREDGTWKVCS